MNWRKPSINRGQMGETMSWLSKLEKAKVEMAARNGDPWRLPLERVRGKIDYDGLERVSSQTLLDMLEVPQRSRGAGGCRRLAKLMAELGWTAVRVRDLTRAATRSKFAATPAMLDAVPPYLIENVRPSAVRRFNSADHRYQGKTLSRAFAVTLPMSALPQ